ncbi:MAG TPA: hypothetical protein PKD51_13825 [Saprospiraceae bacterium]|nr:hypothetical protein [Saprospiraceae bacterium]HMU05633.1 hypothetical protein [Saprospiraceae bacterium]
MSSKEYNMRSKEIFSFKSPIEFVLIGVEDRKSRVLVKSTEAQIDLMGSIQNIISGQVEYDIRDRLFLPASFENHLASADWKPDMRNMDFGSFDSRSSKFYFIWRGKGALKGRDKDLIQKEFERRLPDVLMSISNGDSSTLEWNIAPVVDLCFRASKENERRRNSFIVVGILYLIITIILLFVLINRYNLFNI